MTETSQTHNPTPWRIDAGLSTDVGGVRSLNEDSASVDPGLRLFVVADGMGGHRAGDRASALAVELLGKELARARRAGEPITPEVLVAAIEAANVAIRQEGSLREECSGMGTTVTALVLEGREFLVGHVGDSRAWRVRDGRIDQLTEDHSLVADQLREGIITREQADAHPMRHVLSRALGARDDVDVDLIRGTVEPGDVFVLATDGMVHGLGAESTLAILAEAETAQSAAETLVRRACESYDGDNITAVVVAAELD